MSEHLSPPLRKRLIDPPLRPPQQPLDYAIDDRRRLFAPRSSFWWTMPLTLSVLVILWLCILSLAWRQYGTNLTNTVGQGLPAIKCRAPQPGERLRVDILVQPDGRTDVECAIKRWL